jgi:hypothetical protein
MITFRNLQINFSACFKHPHGRLLIRASAPLPTSLLMEPDLFFRMQQVIPFSGKNFMGIEKPKCQKRSDANGCN